MTNPIHALMAEHRLIEEVLASLDGFATRVDYGGDTPRDAIARYAEFFAQYADRTHHGKEEDLLFSRMVQRGVPASEGPVSIMLSEHVQGRACVEALRQIGRGQGPLDSEERTTLRARSAEYVDLLRHHIDKEDRVLYPIAIRVLSEDDLTELGSRFEELEAKASASGRSERLRELAREIMTAYPPAWTTGTSCDACAGCGPAGSRPW